MARPAVSTAVLVSATFMQFLDVSIVNVASPSIRRDLAASAGATELVASSYTLAFACVLITAGRLGDQYGYRRLYAIGMALFTFASAACALSPDVGSLVSARVLQGLGAGLMAPQVLSLIQIAFPPRRRGPLFAAYGAAIGIATVTGPVLGGLLIHLEVPGLDWRLVFAINVPVGIAALWGIRLLPASARGERAAVDPVGMGLAMTGLALLVYPLTMGHSASWPWWTVVMLCAAPVILAMLVSHQLSKERAGGQPLLKLSLLRDPGLRAGLVVVTTFFAGVPPFFFFLSVYLQSGLGHPAVVAGLAQLPFAAATGAGARWSVRFVERLGRAALAKVTGLLALSMLVIGVIVVARGAAARPWELAAPMVLGGLCFGVFTTTAFTQVLAQVPSHATGSSSGLLTTAQQAAGSLGLAMGGAVFYLAGRSSSAGVPHLVREAHVTGFVYLLGYEVVVFTLASITSLLMARRETTRITHARAPHTR
ncbi:MFS transporter [Amycolatopsis sp. EV170708-02-1]|uniref:MFS transporter n=1 Tax=Amycolatopsis sp. EV170708-02-1 TaxID=2919322 RepID=UPI001F0C7FEF|nr:MFS transporter [Amycolatopsis sp. EV170708-02-1]UMP07010.1 MFS transporter [Amycolatopsis sp. EV170708-02-1]